MLREYWRKNILSSAELREVGNVKKTCQDDIRSGQIKLIKKSSVQWTKVQLYHAFCQVGTTKVGAASF